jgi:hypothetical protein
MSSLATPLISSRAPPDLNDVYGKPPREAQNSAIVIPGIPLDNGRALGAEPKVRRAPCANHRHSARIPEAVYVVWALLSNAATGYLL